jgi:hypothetical protein
MFELIDFTGGTGFGNRLAPFHLFNEKIGGHQGVVLATHVVRRELQKVFSPRQGSFQYLVCFIDPRRPLQRKPPLGLAGTCEPVWVNL